MSLSADKSEQKWNNPIHLRKMYVALFVCSLSMFVAFSIPNDFFAEIERGLIIQTQIFLLFLIIGSGILLAIVKNPRILFKKNYTSIGSLSFVFALTILFVSILKKIEFLNSFNSIIIWGIALIFLSINYYLFFKNSINFIEFLAVKCTNPRKLLFVLEGRVNELNNEKRALIEIEKRINKNDWGYLNKLNEQIIKQFAPKESLIEKIFKYGIVVIVTFIISSLGEGLVQDMWLEDLKKILKQVFN